MSDDLLVAATRRHLPLDGKRWAFYLINKSSEPVESVVLKEVGYEWGDIGNTKNPDSQFGPLAPDKCVEIWRDDDSAAELRMWLTLLIRRAGVTRTLTVEFPKLYLVKTLATIPVLNKLGILGTGSLS